MEQICNRLRAFSSTINIVEFFFSELVFSRTFNSKLILHDFFFILAKFSIILILSKVAVSRNAYTCNIFSLFGVN